jgi:hypothetical protein
MIDQQVESKVIIRLQKLLAMAEKGSGASEAEAELAMAKAQELLAEHNLTMAAVFASGGEDNEKREKTEIKLKHGHGRGAQYNYQRQLMAAIARANFCVPLLRTVDRKWNGTRYTGGLKTHVLVGRESNVIACRMMFDYLNETMERLVPVENGSRLGRTAISWKEGCSQRLCERIEAQATERLRKDRAEREAKAREAATRAQHPGAAPSSSTALVVRLDDLYQREADLNEDARWGYPPGTTERERLESHARWAREEEERKRNPVAVAEPKPETAEEKRDREKWERRWERQRKTEQRRERRAWANKDHDAYFAGQDAGDKIGLDPQIKRGTNAKQLN